ncbi:MAG: hypothetical protein NDF55_04000 [archaeon GB-1867-005]|nr:hypothetical protein [Candidatus Culexmicrobium cathedralense]
MCYKNRDLKNIALLVKLGISAGQLRAALKRFKMRFSGKPKSWFYRCKLRLIDVSPAPKPNMWIVRGRASLGDREAFYIVTFHPRGRLYNCTCYDPKKLFASSRMKQTCTHVGSVILWRMIKERSIYDFLDL